MPFINYLFLSQIPEKLFCVLHSVKIEMLLLILAFLQRTLRET